MLNQHYKLYCYIKDMCDNVLKILLNFFLNKTNVLVYILIYKYHVTRQNLKCVLPNIKELSKRNISRPDVPPLLIILSNRDAAIEHTPAVLVNAKTKWQEGNFSESHLHQEVNVKFYNQE